VPGAQGSIFLFTMTHKTHLFFKHIQKGTKEVSQRIKKKSFSPFKPLKKLERLLEYFDDCEYLP
jgi:hypothetical protein